MKYEEKLEMKKIELRKLEIVVEILQRIQRDCQYMTMEQIDDDSEEGFHWEIPIKNEWRLTEYNTYQEVIELVEKHYFK